MEIKFCFDWIIQFHFKVTFYKMSKILIWNIGWKNLKGVFQAHSPNNLAQRYNKIFFLLTIPKVFISINEQSFNLIMFHLNSSSSTIFILHNWNRRNLIKFSKGEPERVRKLNINNHKLKKSLNNHIVIKFPNQIVIS